MMTVSCVPSEDATITERRAKVLALYAHIQAWPHWEEVYRNAVKESPLGYEAFAQAVQAGDASRQAFAQAMQASQMSRGDFARFLPAFQQFVTLCAFYPHIGMLSDGADLIWHAFILVTDRYAQFCEEVLGQRIEHFPCSLYEQYGVSLAQARSSCVSSCLPSTCSGNGGGGGCKSGRREEADPASITRGILLSRKAFLDAYREVFQTQPDPAIWNQLI